MGSILTNLGLLAGQNQLLAYFIIYIVTIFLGNISAFAGFWMVSHGYFGAWGVPFLMLTILLADFSGDMLWYSLGRALRDTRFGNWVKNHLPRHTEIENHLKSNGSRWVFFSKFLYASAFPIIFSVGWCKINFKKFLRMSILSILIWVPILTGLAYGLIAGLAPLRAVAVFKNFEVVFVTGLVLFVVADYYLVRLLKKIFGKKFAWLNGNGAPPEK
jgi:membrane protein DedA with SNARE-associated domain